MTLQDAVQLHEQVRVVYVVDGYEAVLETKDGDQEVCRVKGDTIQEALESLEIVINAHYQTLDDVRRYSVGLCHVVRTTQVRKLGDDK